MFIDKKLYWSSLYKNKLINKSKSTFAVFCLDYGLDNTKSLIDLGCGIGRDSNYFALNNFNVTACDFIDTSEYINNDITFIHSNIINLGEDNKYGVVYARMLLDAIDIQEQEYILKWAYSVLDLGGLFCIECQSINDNKYGTGQQVELNAFIIKNRYIRFINKKEIIDSLEQTGFQIVYCYENNNLSINIDDNPVLIRIIAQKPY